MSIFGDLPASDYYYLGYIPMVDGYRHAFRDSAGKLHLARKSNHPSDPKCPGCVEDRGPCPQCGHSTHPSLPPCEHHPERADYEQRVKKLARFLPSTRETGGES